MKTETQTFTIKGHLSRSDGKLRMKGKKRNRKETTAWFKFLTFIGYLSLILACVVAVVTEQLFPCMVLIFTSCLFMIPDGLRFIKDVDESGSEMATYHLSKFIVLSLVLLICILYFIYKIIMWL
jgi:hypothetical protein